MKKKESRGRAGRNFLTTVSVSALGIIVCVFVVHVALATPQQLSTADRASWAWMGLPVDQNVTEGASTTSTLGFIHLNCDSWATCSGGTYNTQPNLTIDTTTGDVSGYAWVGTAQVDSGTAHSVGWLNFDPAPLADATYADASCASPNFYPAPPCYSAQIDSSNNLSGWARFETLAAYGDTVLGTSGKNNDWGWVLLRGTNTADSAQFGLHYNGASLEGWAWSGGGTLPASGFSNLVGFGWLYFSVATSTPSTTLPFISTQQGSVYAQSGISNPIQTLTPSQYNATYLILSNTADSIVNFDSELLGEGNFAADDWEALDLPDETNSYTGSLGKIDITKLTTVITNARNIYGNTVQEINDFSSLSGTEFLDGKVIVVGDSCCASSYTIDDAITFANGTTLPSSGSGFDGSGVIVVNGNLTINDDILYNSTALLDIKNLASVAFIIRGDLTIGTGVSQIVGSYMVLGDTNIGDGVGDGAFITLATNAQQLGVYGMVMARAFDLRRTYVGSTGDDQPAELFYYDGRVLAHTPPGLSDYTSVLPIISE